MSVVLVTGGSGTFGSKLVPLLAERGHEVRVLSRRPGAGTHVGDLVTGAGVADAAVDAELIVHAATDNSIRAGRTDLMQTTNLLCAATGCRHLLYLSIVGIDDIPFGYYQRKLACEQTIAASSVPYTTLRATQFHELIDKTLRTVSRWPAALLPLGFRFQSVADWRAARGRPRAVIGVRLPGEVARAFTQGRNTCPEHTDGRQTWAEFLDITAGHQRLGDHPS
jgi:uncharacterized protein YbjT (DUF2867 family)